MTLLLLLVLSHPPTSESALSLLARFNSNLEACHLLFYLLLSPVSFLQILPPFLTFLCNHQDESITQVQIPQMGLPLISPTVSDPYLLNRHWSPTLARLSPTNKVQAVALADLIQHFKWKRVSIMYNNDPYGSVCLDLSTPSASLSGLKNCY